MDGRLRVVGILCGVVAFVVCLFAGLWILTAAGFDHDDDALATGIGLYFVGKAFFVGPMLAITAVRSSTATEVRNILRDVLDEEPGPSSD